MITKERLKELIEQGATIYEICTDLSIHELDLSVVKDKEMQIGEKWFAFSEPNTDYLFKMEHLCETMEDVENFKWHKEFGCIERTERLELPTWEEVEKDLKNYKEGDFYIVDNDHFSLVYNKCYFNPSLFLYVNNGKYFWKATKENYTLACRKAKELFLGEKK